MDQCGRKARRGTEGAALQAGDRTAPQFERTPGAAGLSLDQWSRSTSVWPGRRSVDALDGGQPDRAEVSCSAWSNCGRRAARQVGADATEAAAPCLPARSGSDRKMEA